MIAFKHNRPVLQVGAGFIAEYGLNWLGESLEQAAREAGTSLPFKFDLVAAIACYLEESCPLDVLQLDTLYGKIRHMLKEVGLDHLAGHLPNTPPPYPVSVGEIASRHPLPLFFFNELGHEIEQLQELGLTHYEFTGVRESVLLMQGRKKWTKSCDRLLEDLEFFLSRYGWHKRAA